MKNKLLVLVALLPVTILFMLTAFTHAAAVSVRICFRRARRTEATTSNSRRWRAAWRGR